MENFLLSSGFLKAPFEYMFILLPKSDDDFLAFGRGKPVDFKSILKHEDNIHGVYI